MALAAGRLLVPGAVALLTAGYRRADRGPGRGDATSASWLPVRTDRGALVVVAAGIAATLVRLPQPEPAR
jgi:hypothetical protein